MKIFIAGLPGQQVDLAEEECIFPNLGLDENLGVVNPEFGIGKRPGGIAVEVAMPASPLRRIWRPASSNTGTFRSSGAASADAPAGAVSVTGFFASAFCKRSNCSRNSSIWRCCASTRCSNCWFFARNSSTGEFSSAGKINPHARNAAGRKTCRRCRERVVTGNLVTPKLGRAHHFCKSFDVKGVHIQILLFRRICLYDRLRGLMTVYEQHAGGRWNRGFLARRLQPPGGRINAE